MDIKLVPLTVADREQFILDNQQAFKYGAQKEFGMRDDRMEEGEEVISRKTIERCLDDNQADYCFLLCNFSLLSGALAKQSILLIFSGILFCLIFRAPPFSFV